MEGISSLGMETPRLPGAEQQIIKALKSGDVELIMYTLRYLNHQLTGEESGDFGKVYDEQMPDKKFSSLRRKVESFLSNDAKHLHLYLGDQGASRLAITTENGRLKVDVWQSENDRERKVCKKWEKIK